ncbi:DUF1345 domain-containing protein [Sphingomonas sp. H39-1-10]|uniref:DUF1345 domain-containing protein n=1 Tax=Sphingomonas pollutisoli TaxID=3030829 RepID=UPI0023BA2DDE|nr:DUF1345 domain-containing protein [Sphingomonas pollutisoli]MDF0490623.1 DUF1345 domain-containing protein [Sphingomonas pollutisoli]
MKRLNLGHTVAPPRFIAFGIVFVIGLATAIPALGWSRGAMAAFDAASLVFLILVSSLLRNIEIDHIRRSARNNDANRAGLLVLTGVTMLVILVAVAKELQGKNDLKIIALVIATLVLAWLFSNTVYALHYAHLYYSEAAGKDSGGLDIPECDEPDYWDFLYFSFTLGMTFQTSDVQITSRQLRRVALGHSLAAFVFNLGVLAFTINTLGNAGN